MELPCFSLCLCLVQSFQILIPRSNVHCRTLCYLPCCTVLHSFRTTRSGLRLSRKHNIHVVEHVNSAQFRGRQASFEIFELVQLMEKFILDSDSMLVLHMFLNIFGPRILTISFDILFMADRTGSSKTLETYEEIWIQLRRFQFKKTYFLTTHDSVILFMF